MTINDLIEQGISLDGKIEVKYIDTKGDLSTVSDGDRFDIPTEVMEEEIKFMYGENDKLVIEVSGEVE